MRIGSKWVQYQVPLPFMALVFEILGFSMWVFCGYGWWCIRVVEMGVVLAEVHTYGLWLTRE